MEANGDSPSLLQRERVEKQEFDNRLEDLLLSINYYSDESVRNQVQEFLVKINAPKSKDGSDQPTACEL